MTNKPRNSNTDCYPRSVYPKKRCSKPRTALQQPGWEEAGGSLLPAPAEETSPNNTSAGSGRNASTYFFLLGWDGKGWGGIRAEHHTLSFPPERPNPAEHPLQGSESCSHPPKEQGATQTHLAKPRRGFGVPGSTPFSPSLHLPAGAETSPRSLPIPGSLLGEKKGKKKQALSKVATKGSSYGRGAGQRMAPCLSPFPIRPGWRQLAGKQDAAQEQP